MEIKKQEEKAKKKLGRNQQISGSLLAGWNARQVAEVHGLSYSWSKKLYSRLRKRYSGERKSGSERPRRTAVREDWFLIKEATRQRDAFNNCPSTALSDSLKDRTSRLREGNTEITLLFSMTMIQNIQPILWKIISGINKLKCLNRHRKVPIWIL